MAKRIAITGNTFPVKDQIKALGGKWDPDRRAWMVPEDKAEEAQALVAAAGPKKTKTAAYPDPLAGLGSRVTADDMRRIASSPLARSLHCAECGARKSPQYRLCRDCSLERREGGSRYMGGQSYRTRDGHFVLGDDD